MVTHVSPRSTQRRSPHDPSCYTLANAPQNTVTIRVQLGSGTMFCASAPAKEPVASNDTTEKFNGAKQTPPPPACPHVPGNG
jgi:hypothetical protein